MGRGCGGRYGGVGSVAGAVRRYQYRFTAPTERTPSRESASNGPSVSVETWRAAVPRSRGSPISTPVSRRRRSGRPPGNRPAMAHPFVATMIGGGLEGYGPSQPLPAVNQHRFTAPTERAPSRGPPGNGPSVGANDDRWGPGGLRSLAAVAGRKSTRFHGADGAGALQGIAWQWPIRWWQR